MNKTNQIPDSHFKRRVILSLLGVIALLFVVTFLVSKNEQERASEESSFTVNSTSTSTESGSSATIGQQNALTKAIAYIDSSDFSETKLRSQLEYEGFTTDEIDYAMDIVPADYDLEASNRAVLYYTTQNLSKQRIMTQLEFEGYTDSEINYAIGSLPE